MKPVMRDIVLYVLMATFAILIPIVIMTLFVKCIFPQKLNCVIALILSMIIFNVARHWLFRNDITLHNNDNPIDFTKHNIHW